MTENYITLGDIVLLSLGISLFGGLTYSTLRKSKQRDQEYLKKDYEKIEQILESQPEEERKKTISVLEIFVNSSSDPTQLNSKLRKHFS